MDCGGWCSDDAFLSQAGDAVAQTWTNMFLDMLGEASIAVFFVLALRFVSSQWSASRSVASKRQMEPLSKRDREPPRGGRVSIGRESSVRRPSGDRQRQSKEMVLQVMPDSSGRVGHLWLGTVKSYCTLIGKGVLVTDGIPEDVRFTKDDADDQLVASLRPGCVVTFALKRDSETGTLRAVSLEGRSQVQLARVPHCGASCITGNTLQDESIGFSRNEEVMPESHTVFFTGHIKFWLSDKRHGFIVCKQHQDGDVWLSHEDVQTDKVKHLTAGVPLRFKLDKTGVRPRARQVEVILLSPLDGVVKSYSERKNYGFVSCYGVKEDVWFAASGVEGEKPLGPGMRVRVDTFKSEKGHYRAFRVVRMFDGRV